jgi:hypothetical protein
MLIPPPRRFRLDPDTPWRPRRSQRGWAALVLVALACTGAGCSLGGDGTVFVGSCAHFVATVRTSEPGYAPGQTVIISVIQANDGPVCTTPPLTCGPPAAFASAYNSAGKDVWDNGATKTNPGQISCPWEPASLPNTPWPAHSSATQTLDWGQDNCTQPVGLWAGRTNPHCPGTQVPAGTYRIVGGYWSYWSSSDTLPSASATITISG